MVQSGAAVDSVVLRLDGIWGVDAVCRCGDGGVAAAGGFL